MKIFRKIKKALSRKVIFRPHVFGMDLASAMAEARVFKSKKAMKAWLCEQEPMLTAGAIVISKESIADTRIGWLDTRRVCVTRLGERRFAVPKCIGYCATDFPEVQ